MAVMKIKIRTAHSHTHVQKGRRRGKEPMSKAAAAAPGTFCLPLHLPLVLHPLCWHCSLDCSATGSDCLSLSCHVKMVLRKCIFCIPSANEQHRYTHPLPPIPHCPLVVGSFVSFYLFAHSQFLCLYCVYSLPSFLQMLLRL